MGPEINGGQETRSSATKDIPAIPGFYARPEPEDPAKAPQVMAITNEKDSLYTIVRDDYVKARNSRRTSTEPEWERAWLNENGEYAGSTLQAIKEMGGSQVFVRLTTTKTSAAKSLIMQVHSGPDGMQWGIHATPEPEMKDFDEKTFNAALQMEAAKMPPDQGQAFMASNSSDTFRKQNIEEAERRMEGMRSEIRDYMAEMDMDSFFVRFLEPFVIYGTGVVQGPITVSRKPSYWKKDKEGTWNVALSRWSDDKTKNAELRPEYRMHSLWSVYPDPAARSQEELNYVIVRHVMSRHQVEDLKTEENFDADKIDEVLDRYQEKGNWVQETWESIIELTSNRLEDKTSQFVVLEWTGWISGRRLRNAGIKGIPDSALNRHCIASIWAIDENIIKVVVDNKDPQELGFIFAPYQPVDGRLWGRGVPAQMGDSQDMWNATQRAIMDNMRYSAGPQVVYDEDRISDRTNPNTMYPLKAWGVKGMEGLSQAPVYFLKADNNIQHMQSIQQGLRLHIQMETSIPDFATGIPGAQGHNRTAEGMALQQGMALSFIRSVIAGLDIHFVKRVVKGFYDWAMNFSPKEDIKGDFEVESMGVMAAMSNEILTGKMERMLMAPWAPEVFKMDKLLPELVKRWGLADLDVAYTQEEMQQHEQQKQQTAAQGKIDEKRVSPVMPKINALIQGFNNVPPGSPAYGPWLEETCKELGILTPRMGAALDAINQQAAAQFASNLSQTDLQILASDLSQQEMQGGIHPAEGSEIPNEAGDQRPGLPPADQPGSPAGPGAPDSQLGMAPPAQVPVE